MLQKAAVVAIKASLRDVFDTWIERTGEDNQKEVADLCTSTPAASQTAGVRWAVEMGTRRLVFPGSTSPENNQATVPAPLITPPLLI